MPDYKQKNRILSFTSPLGSDKLLALEFRGVEAISELFTYEATLLADPDLVVQPSALVGKRVTMTMELGPGNGKQRYFNGVVASLETAGGDALFNKYRVRIVPTMWMLSLHKQTRVFQDITVLDIVRKVLEPYSIVATVELKGSYPTLEYCTQYHETDLEFVERLLETHGIFFYFTHSESDHNLVLSDSSDQCSKCQFASDFDFQNNAEGMLDFYKPLIYEFASNSTLISGEHTYWDYRFMQYALSHADPQTTRSKAKMGDNMHEFYDYADSAAAYFKTEEADSKISDMQKHMQTVKRDVADSRAIQCAGGGTANTMQAGFTFTLHKYPQTDCNIKYLLSRVEHSIKQWPPYRAAQDLSSGEPPYRNSFEARPFTQVFRKVPSRPKPRVGGVVTGKVVTKPGEDSHLDKFGRVCVQFWWDRDRPPRTPDNTLLRVAQQWAGNGWGTYFWPRVDDEVLIDFIEGDPDAPIVVGSVYNGVNLPKYDPKSKYTRSGILTRSSKDGGAASANELRFEDRKGSEQIFINAERNLDLHVEHDWHTRVDHQEHRKVADSQYHEIGKDSQLSISGDQLVQVTGERQVSVGGVQFEKSNGRITQVTGVQTNNTGGLHSMQAGGLINVQAGGLVNVQAGGALVLQGAGLLYLVVNEKALAINVAGLEILEKFGVGELGEPPPVVIPPSIVLTPPYEEPEWPGDD